MYIAFLLFALAVGYKVFADASKNPKKTVKDVGRAVGIFIMVLAALGSLCKTYKIVRHVKCGYSCPVKAGVSGGKGLFCPYSGKNAPEGSYSKAKK